MNPIYLDHAATSYPKPDPVLRAVRYALTDACGNPGRGAHPLSENAAELVYSCREEAAGFFEAEPENVVFTPGATYALNFAIQGLAEPGCHILCDNFCHNATRRPILAMAKAGYCSVDFFDASGTTEETLESLEEKLRPETTIVVATHSSNICSKILPVAEIGAFCKRHGLYFIVDAAQSAGHLPISLRVQKISALAVPGHKGLCGPMGVGMLVSAPGIRYRPVIYGGAGIASREVGMPEELPERLEAGTLPVPAIAGLLAGMQYVKTEGIGNLRAREEALSRAFTEGLEKIPGYRTHGQTGGSVVSFTHDRLSPAEIGTWLAGEQICVRTGLHCAPLAHQTIGTADTGTVRVSFSASNTVQEIERILNVLQEIDELSAPNLDIHGNL